MSTINIVDLMYCVKAVVVMCFKIQSQRIVNFKVASKLRNSIPKGLLISVAREPSTILFIEPPQGGDIKMSRQGGA